ncbi:transcriptional regulator [Nissabacter sp. SGAir0207]|nr:transcriptional regulator [Nissabacter sp. SGAir0207]
MPVKMPSFKGLKAFESAARHMSFTKAAEELNVTQTAISHQIRRLEEELGIKLFLRQKNALSLTTEGHIYFPRICAIFNEFRHSTEILLESCNKSTLTISTLVSFASKWLLPRLASFHENHPNIDIQVKASTDLVDLRWGEIDAAIRYGRGDWPGVHAHWLMSDEIFPVCSPALLKGARPLKRYEDLQQHTLLQVSGLTSNDWNLWLEAAGLPCALANGSRLTFDLAMMAIQTTIDGHGICIGRTTYVEDDLRAGRLVRPFDLSLPTEQGFYLVTPLATASSPKIAALRNWLDSTIRHSRSLP